MDICEYFKELHNKELERAETYNERVLFTIGFTGAIGGVAIGLATDLKPPVDTTSWISIGCLMICGAALVFAMINVARSFVFVKYQYPAPPGELHELYEETKEWAQKHNADAQKAFYETMKSEWVRCSNANAIRNDDRAMLDNRARKALFFSLIPLSAASLIPIFKTLL